MEIEELNSETNLQVEREENRLIFSNIVFVFEFDTLVSFKEKTKWRQKITQNGGTVSYIITREVSFVIVVKENAEVSVQKQRQSSRYNIPVLKKDFIDDCLLSQQLLSEKMYLIQTAEKTRDFQKGKICGPVKKRRNKNRKRRHVSLSHIPRWRLDDPAAPVANNDQYQLAKWCILKNNDKIQVLEIHTLPQGQFRLFSQHGVVNHFKHVVASEEPLVWYMDDVSDVVAAYEQQYNFYLAPPNNMAEWKNPTFSTNQIGSNRLKLLISEQCILGSDLSFEVGCFVEMIWNEAIQESEEILATPAQHIKKKTVEDAELLLQKIKKEMTSSTFGDSNKMADLIKTFYTETLPHKEKHCKTTMTRKELAAKLDLCQLLRDLHDASEGTDWSPTASTAAKFWALRCHVTVLDRSSEEFAKISNLVTETADGVSIQAIFEVNRTVEDIRFTRQIYNKRLLMHSSAPSNFLGILSRGLLPPNLVVQDFGVTRTDDGKLGPGIYFSDSASTCLKYSSLAKSSPCRLLVLSEVALGRELRTTLIDTKLTAPPTGYHSVHGVKQGETAEDSDFMDDEYVIYNPCQQRIRYVIQYKLQDDPEEAGNVKCIVPDFLNVDDISKSLGNIDIQDVTNIPDPLTKVQAGLFGKCSQSVPLKAVHIRAKLLDMVAEVKVMQSYHNHSTVAIEAKYVFPLEDTAAVCGFEAFINGKHIIGRVEEKKKAHKEYKEAIKKGHGAYLMDEEEPDVFTVSVGNLPPGADVLIKITYISELQVQGDAILFTLPSRVAPWVKDTALAQKTQDDVQSVKVTAADHLQTSVQVAVEMPFDIHKLVSNTHKLKFKKTATKAVVELAPNSSLEDGFQLQVMLSQIHVPRMWIEQHVDKESSACMLSFYPEFDSSEEEFVEVIILLDMSNSMKDQSAIDAKKVCLLALQKLPEHVTFNVVTFGTTIEELFQLPCQPSKENLNKAIQFIQAATPNLGCSNGLLPLQSLYLLSPVDGIRNVLLVSDGYLNHVEELLQSAYENSSKARVFSLAVGPSPCHHLLKRLSLSGGGCYNYFDISSKSSWERKMVAILDKACQKRITEVKVEWQQHSNNLPAPIQAPACVTSVFSGSRLVVYGYVENCTQAKLTACVNNMTFETVVSTSELNITKGKMLHQLTARAVIKDYEEGISETDPIQQQIFKEERKQMIIELSKEYCIVTPYTSFVAIEERHDDEEKMEGESVDKLVAEEDVDILPYMGWTVPDNWQDMNVEEEVRSLLQQGEIAEGFSQHEAERCYIMALQHAEDIQDNASLQDMVKKTAKNFFEKSDSEKSQQMLKIVHRIAPEKKEIKVKFLSGKMITPELNATDTVADLKARIFDLEGIPLKIQRLIAESKLLNDADSISDLENEETVHLVLNLRGGEEHQQLPKLSTQSFYQKRRKRAIMYRSMEDSPSVDERSSLYSDPVHLISEASHRTGTKEQEHENEDGERVGKKKMKRKKRSYISLTNKTSMSTNGLKPNEDQSSIFPSSSIREECQTGGNFNTPQLLGSQPTSIALQPLPISDEMIDSYMEDFSADAGLMDKLITDLLPEEDDLLDDAVEESDCKVSTPVFSSNKLKPTSQRRPFTSKRSVKRGRRIGFVEVGLKGSSPDSEDDDLQVGCPSDSEKKSTSPKKPIASKRIATKAARREFVEDGLKGSSCSSDTEDDDREISCPSDSEKKTTSQKRPIASKQIPTKAARKEFVEDEVKGSSCSSDSEDEHSEIGCPSDSKDSDEVSSSHSSVLPSIDMTSLHRSMPSGFSLASASHQLSPQYSTTLPSYTHRSPVYQSTTPAYCPISPAYCPTSTTYQPPLPAYCPPPPTDHPALPPYPSASAYRPVWPAYSPASPSYSPLSPSYSPVDLRVAPAFCQKSSPNNQTAYLPTASLPTSNKQEQPRQPFSGMSENQSKQMLESKTGSWSRNSSTAYERTSAGFPLFDRAKIEKPDHENQFQSKFEQYIPNPADSIYMPTLASSVTTSTAAHKTPRGTKGVRKERKISSPEVIARCRSQKSSEGSKSMSISSDRDSIPVRKSGKELKGKLKSVERRSGRQRSRSRSKGSRSMSLCSDSSEGKQEKLREGSRFERNSKCRQKSKSRSRNERVRSKSRSRERRLRSERRSRDRGPRSESRNRDERLKLRGRRRECGQSSKSDSRGLTQRSKSRERERRRRSISSSSDPRQRSRSYEYKGILSRRETDTRSRKGRDINSRSRRRSREPYPRPRSSQRELDSRSRSRSRDYYAMSRSRSRDCYTRSRSRRRDSYSGHRRKDFYSRSRSRDFDPRSRDRHYDSYLRRKMRDLFTLFRRARNRNRYLCTRSRRRRRDFYSRSRSRSRDFYTKSRSWSRDFYTKSRSRSRDFYTRSGSRSRDFYTRSRSRSRDLYTRSRSRNRDLYTRSRSRSRDFYTRSRSTSRDLCTRSRSRSRTFYTRSRSRSKQGPKSRVNTKLNCTVPDLWNGIILHHSRVSIDKLPTPVEGQYWELTQDSMSKIGVCADKVRQILNQHGIRSLGKSTEELICRITATLLIAVHQFMCNIRKNNLSVDDSFLISSSIRDFQSTDSNRITIQLSNFEKVEFDFPKKSFDWLKSMISQWSYLIDHLEMGRGLRDFLISVYTQFKRN